jgi:UDP-N-acetylglucosamine--N-acetylmuramyl-(pentapeptide) pyrophosphoryl-undecaprenol N-acetylglucosamine transferase
MMMSADSFRVPRAPRRVALVGGGTAGHVYPALAVAEAYRAAVPGTSPLFIGTPNGFERSILHTYGERLVLIDGAPFFGVGMRGRLRTLSQLARGTYQARHLLRTEAIALVVGFGGYASAGVLLAGRSLGLRTVIHEANLLPGLANRLVARIVDRVHLGFEAAKPWFPPAKTVVTGIPIRQVFMRIAAARRPPGARGDGTRRLLVTGGSLGSDFLNRCVPDLVRRVKDHGVSLEVRHQTGNREAATVGRAYADAGIPAVLSPYIDDMPAAYAWADAAITCAGAITLAELAAAGLPALVVPYAPASEDHQRPNARAFAEATGVWWVPEEAWHPAVLAERLASLLTDDVAWSALSARLRGLAPRDAAARVVADCESLLCGTE